MKIGYYAVFDYTEEETYGISIYFPDIPECISCSKSEKEGFFMAKDVLELITTTMKVYELPKVTPLESIKLNDNEKAFFISFNTEDIDLSTFIFYDDDGNVITMK
ncbi:hypothetical protein LGL55_22700 [Clostridium tagluense]|uniref:type II toxin-antitoxin system HicB family antitoxin n=1 Tax=Clostridium tagluense TaxID=360422 RepID=UPI001C0B64F2|nr:hypothetical protein [Clostridium tagluense]MBU3130494.1 hypothetical protein [Clostridium tagluense]MCB2311856.1 hypothetical protein [Clostridium tagluense]MCB2317389.1 hypothetical protein [Clostridium tagluense]MCB2323740.1 hypothetical protein [Clostridium tagluense]MCB2326943.1 hypothetical protein [Clostridium tagluense]